MLIKVMDRDDIFNSGDAKGIWNKYCSFLDLSTESFIHIQESLLKEQLHLLNNSLFGKMLIGNKKIDSKKGFRELPLTTYSDYESFFKVKDESILPMKPAIWAHTSGRTGFYKWAPYSNQQVIRIAQDTVTAFILAAARSKGDVRLKPGAKVVLNLPPLPYPSGIMGAAAVQCFDFRPFPPLEKTEDMSFEERISNGFSLALNEGADFAASMAAVLVKIGEDFARMGRKSELLKLLLRPGAAFRIARAFIKARMAKRQLLPKDVWSLSGIICGGTDSSIYRDRIFEYWGVQPLDVYVATETGFMAMQTWDKSGMTFVPFSNYYEFIPETESRKSYANPGYIPKILSIGEVEEGQIYELVITNFNGGPFIRYHFRDLIKINSLKSNDGSIKLPQMSFYSRIDDIIDLAGFCRLDEKTMWNALQNSQIKCTDWSVRKEYNKKQPVLHFYLELSQNGVSATQLSFLLDEQLRILDRDYKDLRSMTDLNPIRVTVLNLGSFERYRQNRQASGADLAHLKPPHMNASDEVITILLSQSALRSDKLTNVIRTRIPQI